MEDKTYIIEAWEGTAQEIVGLYDNLYSIILERVPIGIIKSGIDEVMS